MEVTMRAYWAEGSQIHVHTNGDLAMQVITWCYPHILGFITDELYNYSHNDQVVLDIVEKLEGEKARKSHRTTIEHAGFFTPAQVLSLLIVTI